MKIPTRHQLISAFSLATLALASMQTLAHEFWIEPSAFRVIAGDTVSFRFFVGDGFPGEPRPRDPRKLVRFVAVGPGGTTALQGSDGSDPASSVAFTTAGTYVVGYRSNDSLITLEAAKFESYLKEEGLDHVVKARDAAGDSTKPGREKYSRAAKTIVRVDAPKATASLTKAASSSEPRNSEAAAEADSTNATQKDSSIAAAPAPYATTLNFPAEIFPTSDPSMITAGSSHTFRIMHNNEPAKDVLVLAFAKDAQGEPLKQRTNEQGQVTFHFASPGMWMIANVLMQPTANKSDADWESIWASLTLDVASTGSTELANQKSSVGTDPKTE